MITTTIKSVLPFLSSHAMASFQTRALMMTLMKNERYFGETALGDCSRNFPGFNS